MQYKKIIQSLIPPALFDLLIFLRNKILHFLGKSITTDRMFFDTLTKSKAISAYGRVIAGLNTPRRPYKETYFGPR